MDATSGIVLDDGILIDSLHLGTMRVNRTEYSSCMVCFDIIK